jgi:hypothetical protein
MTSASAWLDGECATEAEKEDARRMAEWYATGSRDFSTCPRRTPGAGTLHTFGENKGMIFIWTAGNVEVSEEGDYATRARAALDALFVMDPRVAEFNYSIKIIP